MKKCLSCAQGFESDLWRCPFCSWEPVVRGGRLSFAAELAERNSGFSREYFAHLAEIESGHFWFESRNRVLVWALGRYFPEMKSVLEIGCGTGFVLIGLMKTFTEVRFSGSEIFSDGLDFAARRIPGVELLQMDACNIPYISEFDVVGAFDVLEHIDEDQQVLRQMHDAVKPGGGIVLTVPQHPWLWSDVDSYSYHKRRYSRAELLAKVQQAGFRVVFVTSFITLLLPALMISRYRYRHAKGFARQSEAKVNSILNRFFALTLSLERFLVQRQLSLPVGGSLLLIARRDLE